MQTKLPDIKGLQELQDLPEQIESKLRTATKKLKKAVLTNFAAVNDWIFKTSKPDKWIVEFDHISGGFEVFSEKDGDKFSIFVKKGAEYRASIYMRYVQGKPMFNIKASSDRVNYYDYSYYFDENDVFVVMPLLMPISVAKKMLLSEINRLEKSISDTRGCQVSTSLFDRIKERIGLTKELKTNIKERIGLTKELKTNIRLLNDLNEIEHLACGKYPRGTLDDHDAIDFLEKMLDFLTKSIPNHVQGMINDKRKELERVRQLAGEEKGIVSMPTMDEIVKQNDENFKGWGQPSGKLQEEKKITGDENEKSP